MASQLTHFAARIVARISRYRPVQAWLRGLSMTLKQEQTSIPAAPGLEVPETLAITPRVDAAPCYVKRLNLLVPAVSQQHLFGGIETALQVFAALGAHFPQLRIIVTDESAPEPRADAYYGNWPILALAHDSPAENHIVAAGNRWNQTLAIHADDIFMATAWWTAHNGFSLLEWQQQKFPQVVSRKMAYLIQDYEPGFYSWSTRYVLAQATYAHLEHTVSIVNSRELAHYLQAQGHQFSSQFVLEPRLHPKLAAARSSKGQFNKERVLLVYGRPGTERNAFIILIAALRTWAQTYGQAAQWQVVSAGESFPNIDLGAGCQLQSLGKMPIAQYAELLSRTAVGMSLMISPHPSYPPLEMAAFGVRTITNRFANKNLADYSSYVTSVDQPDVAHLSLALTRLTGVFDAGTAESKVITTTEIDWQGTFLSRQHDTWDWVASAASAIGS